MKPDRIRQHKFFLLFLILPLLCAFSFGKKDGQKEDLALFPGPEAFAEWDLFVDRETAKTTISREIYPDNSLNIGYSLDTQEDCEEPLNIKGVVGYEISAFHAKMSHIGNTAGFAFGTLGAVSIQNIGGVKTYGDESSLSLLVAENGPFGNLFLVRKANKTYLLAIAGMYFDDPALWDDFIRPYMTYFETYDPIKTGQKKDDKEGNKEEQ